jgi:hypothetical protein
MGQVICHIGKDQSNLDWELEFTAGESTVDDDGARDIRGRALNTKKI